MAAADAGQERKEKREKEIKGLREALWGGAHRWKQYIDQKQYKHYINNVPDFSSRFVLTARCCKALAALDGSQVPVSVAWSWIQWMVEWLGSLHFSIFPMSL